MVRALYIWILALFTILLACIKLTPQILIAKAVSSNQDSCYVRNSTVNLCLQKKQLGVVVIHNQRGEEVDTVLILSKINTNKTYAYVRTSELSYICSNHIRKQLLSKLKYCK